MALPSAEMSLTRAWIGRLAGISFGAALAPACMLAALAVLALGGGVSLGSLSQLLSGPAAAPTTSVGGGGGHASATSPAAAGALALAPTTTPATSIAAVRALPGARNQLPGTPRQPAAPTAPRPGRGNPVAPARGGSSSGSGPGAGSGQTLADQVAASGSAFAAGLPAPLAGTAQQTLTTAAQTVDQLPLPPIRANPPTVPAPPPAPAPPAAHSTTAASAPLALPGSR